MNRKAFVSICVAILVSMLGMGIISPLMAIYAREMGASGLWLGLMYSGFSASRAIIQPFSGWFSDHKERKTLMAMGLALYTTVSIGYALVANKYQLTTVRFIHGFASSMVIPVAQAYVGDLTPRGKEGTYINIFSMCMMMGMGLGPTLGGTLSDLYNMDTAFYVMAALAAMGLLLLGLFVPKIPPQKKRGHADYSSIGTMLKDNRVKSVSMFMASRGIFRQMINAFLPLFAIESLNMSRTTAGLIVTIFLISEGVVGGVFGPICDRFNKKVLMVTGSFVAPGILFLLPGMRSFGTIIAVLIPVSLFSGIGRAPAMALNVEAGKYHGRMGSAMGILHGAMDLGHFIGPIMSGWIIDHYGTGSVFYLGAVLGILSGFFVTYWIYQRQPQFEKPREATPEPALTQR